jgi:hypothetical protein
MTRIKNSCKKWALILILFAVPAVAGCEGTDTRSQVDDTVEELAGKKNIDRMEQMKQDIDTAAQQQADRFKQADESAGEK